MIELQRIKRTDSRLLSNMENHYSRPKGFVGRNLCYAVMFEGLYYGGIVAGSATLHLAGRKEWLDRNAIDFEINSIINNIFFHIEGPYPIRNFAQKVLSAFHSVASSDWLEKYGDKVVAFETLVELPRTGEVYKRVGYELVGQTKGYTCKREGGKGTDSWSGKRVWNTDKNSLRPKLVLMKKNKEAV